MTYTSDPKYYKEPAYMPIRVTFGIVNPITKNFYADIKTAYIRRYILDRKYLWGVNYIVDSIGTQYILTMDSALRDKIRVHGTALAIISLQKRTNINIAVARIDGSGLVDKEERVGQIEEGE